MIYKFQTKEFGISDEGIHLLRNRFNYETINYSKLKNVSIKKGKELNNWWVILLIGISFLSFSIYYTVGLFDIFNSNEVNRIYIEEIIIPVLPFLIGVYFVYSSMQNGLILKLETINGKNLKLPLKAIDKERKMDGFVALLKEKTPAMSGVFI